MVFQKIGGRLVDVISRYDFFVSYTWADGGRFFGHFCPSSKFHKSGQLFIRVHNDALVVVPSKKE
jgi:hypothetical protein